jgi:hypothetical protein
MRKNPSFASHAFRLIAAASLACTVATVGCTTDRTPGAGAPQQQYAPTTGPTMPSTTPGTEQNRPVNPPMISSYTASPGAAVLQRVDTDAIAIAAANQSYRGRYLGIVDPSGVASYASNPQSANFQTGQFINPAQFTNPEITVNRSISSEPTEVVTSGVDAGTIVSGVAATPVSGAVTSAITAGLATPTTAATTLTPNTAANTVANATTAATSNTAAPVINNAGGFLTPTMSSGATMSPTVAANPGVSSLATASTVRTINTTIPSGTVRTSRLTTATGATTAGLVVGRSASGTVTITNVTTPGLRLH